MNGRQHDPLDHSIRSALHDIVSESPTPGELPVPSTELSRSAASSRPRRFLLVAAATLVLGGVAGTLAIANRSADRPTTTLDPAEATEELTEAQALLDETLFVETAPSTVVRANTSNELPASGGLSDPSSPLPALTQPERPAPDVTIDTTPVTVILSNSAVFNVSVPRQIRAGETLLIEWSVEDSNGIEQTSARVGGASGFVHWCDFPIMGSRISGDERLGRYRAGCAVPANAPNGKYTVFFLVSSREGTPTKPLGTSQVTFEVVSGSNDDSPPTISQVSMPSAASVGDTITITWRAADPSGVDYSYAWFANGGFALADGTRVVDYGDLGVTRISGNEIDGVYSQTVRFYDRSPLGTYTVWFGRRDGVGNRSIDQVAATIVLSA